MEKRVDTDIVLTKKILNDEESENTLYFETNEYIKEILDNFDIKNKKVLTVLGSGDQAFHFYSKKALKVDLFDINRLTIYYYYLRRWVIKYLKKSYPDYNFDSKFLRNLLKKVSLKDCYEKSAYDYWTLFANLLDELHIESKYFFYDRCLLKK